MNKAQFLQQVETKLKETEKRLRGICSEESAIKPVPDRWSAKEILGHLIDSALNNTIRFINGQFQCNLIFSGYDQDRWVILQHYQEESWESLIKLWSELNKRILKIIEAIPEEILNNEYQEHNLDHIAWKKVSKNQPATLSYLIEDYFRHMQHHLEQIFSMYPGHN
ncbi:MAG: DinB family protein [Calditrichaeota bacterium]|nr:DinB family protein [Calditrichota bacterium]